VSPALLGSDEFLFLGERGSLRELGWDGPQREKLWRYNQHYFDDLNARDAETRADWHRDLIDTWIRENPPGRGSGWEPYPTSLRMVNWVKWALAGNPLPDACCAKPRGAGSLAAKALGAAPLGQPPVCERQGAGVCGRILRR
jgi:hypothetical protein